MVSTGSFRASLVAGGILAAGLLAAYGNSFGGVFVFDDLPAIVENPTIRHLWPPGELLAPPAHTTVSGRPLVNLSLALSRALSGPETWGYHAGNLLLHFLAALTLYGLVRRTLQQPRLRSQFGGAASLIALAVALLWALHPLQTESVTYLVQRAESLMGLCYLLTVYCFIRATRPTAAPSSPKRWFICSIVCCLLGMAAKEVMVTAPLLVLLYDRMFVSGTFRAAWQQHGRYYAGLAGTWILLVFLMATGQSRGGSAGFDVAVAWQDYAATQLQAVAHYVRLVLWPDPLVFDYGQELARPNPALWRAALVPAVLSIATIFAVGRNWALGFVGAWFMVILSPTSTVVPVATQAIAEHRLYLSLAAPAVLVVLGAYRTAGRGGLFFCLALAVVLGGLTGRRNETYRSALSLWTDTVIKRPGNARAHDNLATALVRAGRVPEALTEYAEAARLRPGDARIQNNLANALALAGRLPEAVEHFQQAIRLKLNYAEARYNLASAWMDAGRLADAIGEFETVLRLQPEYGEAHDNLAMALGMAGRFPEALVHHEKALSFLPGDAQVHFNFGLTLEQVGRRTEAAAQYAQVLQLQPDGPMNLASRERLRALGRTR